MDLRAIHDEKFWMSSNQVQRVSRRCNERETFFFGLHKGNLLEAFHFYEYFENQTRKLNG